jgi:lipoprotein-anchoring transpeptidase ErfK/SrfK
VLRGDRVEHRFQVAVGTDATPTPTGEFHVSAKLRPPRISPVFGSWALALSAWSDVLDQFGTGDGQIALHGTRSPASIGRAVSNGCVRLHDPAVAVLADLLPLGTPVTIRG